METFQNITLEHLRALRKTLDEFRSDTRQFIAEQRAINLHVGSLVHSEMITRAEIDKLKERIERLETQLQLTSMEGE